MRHQQGLSLGDTIAVFAITLMLGCFALKMAHIFTKLPKQTGSSRIISEPIIFPENFHGQ